MSTEDLKPKRVRDTRARDGMLKHLIDIKKRHLEFPMLVWKTTIIAETQMVLTQFGATQQTQLKKEIIVSQLINDE
jgi:hypothetical protein